MSRTLAPLAVAILTAAGLIDAPARAATTIPAVGLLRNMSQDLCLDVGGYDGKVGDGVSLWSCDRYADQGWGFDAQGHIVNGGQGNCYVPASGNAQGALVKIAACTTDPWQQWFLRPTSTGAFQIVHTASGMCLDMDGAVGSPGILIHLWGCDAGVDQTFRFDTTSADAKATLANISATNQAKWFTSIASDDPTKDFTAAGLVAALAARPKVLVPGARVRIDSLSWGRSLDIESDKVLRGVVGDGDVFEVVDGGNGMIALRTNGTYLRMDNFGQLNTSGPADPALPPEWTWERFTEIPLAPINNEPAGRMIELYNAAQGQVVRMYGPQGGTGKSDLHGVAASPVWTGADNDRFRVTLVSAPRFSYSASASVGGGDALVKGLDPAIAAPLFGGPGGALYSVSKLADGKDHVLRWSVSGDLDAPLSAPSLGDLGCWDRNRDGVNAPEEDTTQDGVFDANDCTTPKCWTADYAGPVRGSGPDGKQDYHDCEFACWDTNKNHKYDKAEESKLTTDAKKEYATRTQPYSGNRTRQVACSSDLQCGQLAHPGFLSSQVCDGGWCTGYPDTLAPPQNVCSAGNRGAMTSTDLGALAPPSPANGWTAWKKVFGAAGAMYAIDNKGDLYVFRGGAHVPGKPTASTGFSPPAKIDSGWSAYSAVFGGLGGVIYAVDPTAKTLLYFRTDPIAPAASRWPVRAKVIASSLPGTTAFGGVDGAIYVPAGSQLWVYSDALRDGTALAAPKAWGGDAPITAVAGGAAFSVVGGTKVLGTKLATNPVSTIAAVPGSNTKLCLPGTGICLVTRTGGTISGSGTSFALKGALSLVSDFGSWDINEANLTANLDPVRPSVSGECKVGMPTMGPLSSVFTNKVYGHAKIAIGYGGSFTVAIGAGQNAIPTDPDKFYVYAEVDGDITVGFMGNDIDLFSLLPVAGLKQGKLLFEPTTPIIYADGVIAYGLIVILGNNMLNWWQDPVLGFSLGPCIPYTLQRQVLKASVGADGAILHDQEGSTEQVDVCGNVMIAGTGHVELEVATLDIVGAMNVDLDLDNDSNLVWSSASERNDFAFAIDGDVTVSIATGMPTPVGGSIYYEGVAAGGVRANAKPGDLSRGRLRLAAAGGGVDPLEGTMLAPLQFTSALAGIQLDVFMGQVGQANVPSGSTPEYGRLSWGTFSLMGWQAASVLVTLSRVGAWFQMAMNPLLGATQITLTGNGNWDKTTPARCGDYTASGPVCAREDQSFKVAGYTLANSVMKTDFNQVTLEGDLSLGAITARLSGSVVPSTGAASLSGSVSAGGSWTASVDVAGTTVTGAVSVSGTASLALDQSSSRFTWSGSMTASGCYPDRDHCAEVSAKTYSDVTIDASGDLQIANPFESGKTLSVHLGM